MALLPDASRSELARLVRRGAVRVDGQRVQRTNFTLMAGSWIEVGPAPVARKNREARGAWGSDSGAKRGAKARELPPLEVVFEDEQLAVVAKPAGLLCHAKGITKAPIVRDDNRHRGAGGLAARRGRGGDAAPPRRGAQDGGAAPQRATDEVTLADLAVARFGRLPLLLGEHRPGIVHRLDRHTSGLILIARTGEAMENLREAFRERRVEKAYFALVHGDPAWDEVTLDWDLTEGEDDRRGWRTPGSADDGKERQTARTHVEVLERYGHAALVLCNPETGRRHQIRVHLLAAEHPIIGDALYTRRETARLERALRPRRHMLHAGGLAFAHPLTGEGLEAELPPPDDMQAVIERLADGR